MLYTRLKESFAEGSPPMMVNIASAAIASMAATLCTQPFDVVRYDSRVAA